MKKLVLALIILLTCFAIQAKSNVIGIDVRTWAERKINSAKGSLAISRDDLKEELSKRKISKEQEIVVFCEAGVRAGKAKKILNDLGYKKVKNIGSWREWNKDYTK